MPATLRMLLLSCLLVLAPLSASAQQAEATRVGYVDIKRVLDASPQMRAGLSRIKSEFAELERKLQLDETLLKELKTQRERGATTMPKAELDQLMLKIEAVERAIKRGREAYAQRVTVRSNELQKDIERQIGEVIAAVAKQLTISIVLDADTMVYGHPRLDLTDAVITKLNAAEGGP